MLLLQSFTIIMFFGSITYCCEGSNTRGSCQMEGQRAQSVAADEHDVAWSKTGSGCRAPGRCCRGRAMQQQHHSIKEAWWLPGAVSGLKSTSCCWPRCWVRGSRHGPTFADWDVRWAGSGGSRRLPRRAGTLAGSSRSTSLMQAWRSRDRTSMGPIAWGHRALLPATASRSPAPAPPALMPAGHRRTHILPPTRGGASLPSEGSNMRNVFPMGALHVLWHMHRQATQPAGSR